MKEFGPVARDNDGGRRALQALNAHIGPLPPLRRRVLPVDPGIAFQGADRTIEIAIVTGSRHRARSSAMARTARTAPLAGPGITRAGEHAQSARRMAKNFMRRGYPDCEVDLATQR